MKLLRIDIDRSPDRPSAVRLSGVVRYDDPRGGRAEETYWYDVPEAFASSISDSGNPWLAGLLPVAVAPQRVRRKSTIRYERLCPPPRW